MTTYVLTQKDKHGNIPVATTSSRAAANRWAGKSACNDWFQFDLNKLAHLGMTDVLDWSQPVSIRELVGPHPVLPGPLRLDPNQTTADHMMQCYRYVAQLSRFTEECAAYMRGVAEICVGLDKADVERMRKAGDLPPAPSVIDQGTEIQVSPARSLPAPIRPY